MGVMLACNEVFLFFLFNDVSTPWRAVFEWGWLFSLLLEVQHAIVVLLAGPPSTCGLSYAFCATDMSTSSV